jgi:hypothetical protein
MQHQFINFAQPVVSESYDEILFTDPSDKFHHMLMAYCPNGDSRDPQSTAPVSDAQQQSSSSSSATNKAVSQSKQNLKTAGAVMQPVRRNDLFHSLFGINYF